MNRKPAFITIVFIICTFSNSALGHLDIEGYNIDISSMSGMLDLSRPDGKHISLAFEELSEKDTDGNSIQVPGHSITKQDFAGYNFSFIDPCTKLVRNSNGIYARYFNYETKLPIIHPRTRLVGEVNFLTKPGLVIAHNEVSRVKQNEIKVTFSVYDWKWCRSCDTTDGQNLYGEYLDLVLSITLSDDNDMVTTTNNIYPIIYDIGSDMTMSLSRMVRLDLHFTLFL